MDAIVKNFPHADDERQRPTQQEAEEAVRVLLRWAGDDPSREGLADTPARVAKSYRELFSGYDLVAEDVLGRTFEEVAGYDDMVLVKDIPFYSHCEHHMVPIIGKAHVAYLPDGRVLGLSKIARVVDIYGRRLQTQEAMTAQIAKAIDETLRPRGVAVMIEAALAGQGAALVPEFLVADHIRAGRLRNLFPEHRVGDVQYRLAVQPSQRSRAPVRNFVRWITNAQCAPFDARRDRELAAIGPHFNAATSLSRNELQLESPR